MPANLINLMPANLMPTKSDAEEAVADKFEIDKYCRIVEKLTIQKAVEIKECTW
jgi:hypothetical protein